MTVRILIVTHNNIGHELLKAVASMIDISHCNIKNISIPSDINASQQPKYSAIVKKALDETAEKTLILCDIFGATPYNLVKDYTHKNHTALISGINLAMLLKAVQLTEKSLNDITQTAKNSAQNSIISE